MGTILNKQTRIAYLDILRILACILVVTVHVSAMEIDTLPLHSADYFFTNAYNCIGFLGVALFVMISGALLLGDTRDSDSVTEIKKPVFGAVHFFALYYIWKACYQVIDLLNKQMPLTVSAIKNDVILALIKQRGYYHLWFLPMIALVYLAVPVIKRAMAERRVCEYFLFIFFIVSLLFPTLFHYEFKFKYLFVDFFDANDFSFFSGYLGYFILGHYLNWFCNGESSRKRYAVYIFGIAGFGLAVFLGFRYSLAKGTVEYVMNTPFTPMMFILASAVFTACKQLDKRFSFQSKTGRMLHALSRLTLGIYLLHPAVLLLAERIGFVPSICTPLLSIPVIVVCVTVVCGAVSFLALEIPVLQKLIR